MSEIGLLRAAYVPQSLLGVEPQGLLDISIADGRIVEIVPAGAIVGPSIDCLGGMVLPCFVDMHTHIDKGHIWSRVAHTDGTLAGAIDVTARDRGLRWTSTDVTLRMEFSLKCAYAHGTSMIRTHIDSAAPQHLVSWPVFAEMRERWSGRIELQAVAIATPQDLHGKAGEEIADITAEHGGIMGGVPFDHDTIVEDTARIFDLAEKRGLDLDLHVDENLDPQANALRVVAETAIERRFPGRIVCGHCCSLAVQDETTVRHTLDLVAKAGIAIVSLPMCNMYLQDRSVGRTPRQRGVTVVQEMRARGIDVAVASDNTRDPFHAFGDLDMHEVLRESVRIAHLDEALEDALALVTTAPARICGSKSDRMIEVGAPADLVLYQGRSMNEILARPESGRQVLRGGVLIDSEPPDFSELDSIVGTPRS